MPPNPPNEPTSLDAQGHVEQRRLPEHTPVGQRRGRSLPESHPLVRTGREHFSVSRPRACAQRAAQPYAQGFAEDTQERGYRASDGRRRKRSEIGGAV